MSPPETRLPVPDELHAAGYVSSVRQRVLRHARRLLRTAALGTAVPVAGCASRGGCIPFVCDPLPPPCTTQTRLADAIRGTAHWTARSETGATIRVELTSYWRDLDFMAAPTVSGAQVTIVEQLDYRLVFDCRLEPGGTGVIATVPVQCGDAERTAYIEVSPVGDALTVDVGE